jgi:hypothetical protein
MFWCVLLQKETGVIFWSKLFNNRRNIKFGQSAEKNLKELRYEIDVSRKYK